MKTIGNLGNLEGKKVLVRADFNVPLSKEDGKTITDDGRIKAALPTIKKLLENGAAVLLMAHLGRPKHSEGNTDDFEFDQAFSLAPVAARLSELLGKEVILAKDTVGEDASQKAANLKSGDILLLENVRFNLSETSKDDSQREAFANKLASLADVYVSDGFGVVHRKQASVYDVAKILPAAAGELVFKEVDALSKAINNPNRPFTVILGGSKVSDKLGVISNLLKTADAICIGGGMAYTFMAALGYEVGESLCERDQIETAQKYMDEAKERGVKLLIPIDTTIASEFPSSKDGKDVYQGIVDSDKIPADKMGLDIGTKTAELFAEQILASKTVCWNGPMGVFEKEAFANGTALVAAALSDATKNGSFTIIGGGDSAAAARILNNPKTSQPFDESSDFSHISTGGGASLEFLEGKKLPGLEVLQ